ncbi:MAG: spermidine/putrescine ABC transporter substrate-binding protein, partial [Oscillospiraceae bacterium]|nr:spermidine/putrescine ABC transporter substrate-binding protein [Oscillospiraceae bacterium]
MKKRILALVLGVVMLASVAVVLTGCGTTANDGGLSRIQDQLLGEYTRDLAGTTLNVVNWGEFIATGPELHIVRAFETLTGINVNYSTFNTNDELHTRLTAGGESFDLTFPSDYMIQRLINEGNLNRINFDNITNLHFIQRDVHGLDMLDLWFDPGGLYSVPYVWGMTGLIYNYGMLRDMGIEAPTSWTALWDERLDRQILMFESSRDSFAVAKFILGLDVNSEYEGDWHAAAELLREQAPLVRQYVGDEIYDIMIGGNAALGPYYVGCFLLMRTLTDEDLRFVFPEEGVNFFVDSMVIPATSQNQRGAEM